MNPGSLARCCFPAILYIVQVGYFGKSSSYKGDYVRFCKIMDLGELDTRCGIGLHDIHRLPRVDG